MRFEKDGPDDHRAACAHGPHPWGSARWSVEIANTRVAQVGEGDGPRARARTAKPLTRPTAGPRRSRRHAEVRVRPTPRDVLDNGPSARETAGRRVAGRRRSPKALLARLGMQVLSHVVADGPGGPRKSDAAAGAGRPRPRRRVTRAVLRPRSRGRAMITRDRGPRGQGPVTRSGGCGPRSWGYGVPVGASGATCQLEPAPRRLARPGARQHPRGQGASRARRRASTFAGAAGARRRHDAHPPGTPRTGT